MGGNWSNVGIPLIVISGSRLIDAIASCVEKGYDEIDKLIYVKASFDRSESPRCARAVIEHIKAFNKHLSSGPLLVTDGLGTPEYKVPNGVYTFETDRGWSLVVVVSDSLVTLKAHARYIPMISEMPVSYKNLRDEFETIYSKYNGVSKIMITITLDGKSWGFPQMRPPREHAKMMLTKDMEDVKKDADTFIGDREYYKQKAMPYKRCYFLYGEPGTGKSAVVELLSSIHNMTVYMLSLNAKDVDDSRLIHLVSNVAPSSIIVVDEIDKQLASLKSSGRNGITISGILSALDGPQRLPYSTIVVLTANKSVHDILPAADADAFMRPGRIDKVVSMKDKFV